MTATIQEEQKCVKVKDLYLKSLVVVQDWDTRFQMEVTFSTEEENARCWVSIISLH